VVVAVAAVLVALIPIGRWEARRHARAENAGMRTVIAAIGRFDSASLDAYRQGVGTGFDCLLYKRGANPFALEFCFDSQGRVIEAYDRRGSSPKIWSLREDPSAATIHVDRAPLERLLAALEKPA
jgi:hypothetical protein